LAQGDIALRLQRIMQGKVIVKQIYDDGGSRVSYTPAKKIYQQTFLGKFSVF